MINIKDLSRIGIGTYRMSVENNEHKSSFMYALEKGINLIDSASNYQNGNSERLIGSCLNNFDRQKVFIVTKAGYIQGIDIGKIKELNIKKIIKISDSFYYSIDIEFIKYQFYESLKKLNTDYIDCFLIHNPEHYFDVNNPYQEFVNDDILEVFSFMEDLVKNGKLRYYGISSNNIPKSNFNGIDIYKIFENKKKFPSFKFLQFPYNLIENEASSELVHKKSLIDLCIENDILTMSNRPINTTFDGKVLRLAEYNYEVDLISDEKEEELFHFFLLKITDKLKEFGEYSSVDSFLPVKFFIENRKIIANSEAIDKAINNYLMPFLFQIQLNTDDVMIMVSELRNYWVLYSKQFNANRLNILKKELVQKNIITIDDKRDFTTIACDFYFKQGINHVLMGLRSKRYIDEILKIL